MAFRTDRVDTPIGALLFIFDGPALVAADFEGCETRMRSLLGRYHGGPAPEPGRSARLARIFERYFAGDPTSIDGIEVRTGGTPFQRRVWTALREIPAGETMTYSGLALRLGLAKTAARAVGHANGANPVSVVVPCHRLVGADGTLTGYAGGIARKDWLLRHEGAR